MRKEKGWHLEKDWVRCLQMETTTAKLMDLPKQKDLNLDFENQMETKMD